MKRTCVALWYENREFGYELFKDAVVRIEEHQARGQGDLWFYDVFFKDGRVRRMFTFDQADFVDDPKE